MTTLPPLLEPVELEVRPAVAEALPLPEARKPDEHGAGWFTAGQMRAYAATAVAAERERCAGIARKYGRADGSSAQQIAAEILGFSRPVV